MKTEENEISINGTVYVPKTDTTIAESIDGMPYKIIRTRSAGVFAGYIKEKVENEVTLVNARRLWYWKGAASLSQLAMEGVSCPNECKFPVEIKSIILPEVIEIISVTEKAKKSISEVPVWKA